MYNNTQFAIDDLIDENERLRHAYIQVEGQLREVLLQQQQQQQQAQQTQQPQPALPLAVPPPAVWAVPPPQVWTGTQTHIETAAAPRAENGEENKPPAVLHRGRGRRGRILYGHRRDRRGRGGRQTIIQNYCPY